MVNKQPEALRLVIPEMEEIGFIAAGDGKEYFFHQSACAQTPFDALREGDTVTFDVGQGPKGPRAENVRPV